LPGLRKYVLDTNCYVDAVRNPAAAAALEAFTAAAGPWLYLSAVVAAELRAGARTTAALRTLERAIIAPYERRARVLVPSGAAWNGLGRTLGELSRRDGLDVARAPRSFAFDILIAWSCREAGAILVSRNTADLARIRRVFAFEFVTPFPPA
jgi:predicted nucleic acid-binding protein